MLICAVWKYPQCAQYFEEVPWLTWFLLGWGTWLHMSFNLPLIIVGKDRKPMNPICGSFRWKFETSWKLKDVSEKNTHKCHCWVGMIGCVWILYFLRRFQYRWRPRTWWYRLQPMAISLQCNMGWANISAAVNCYSSMYAVQDKHAHYTCNVCWAL